MSLSFVLFTHSEYSHIWPLVFEQMNKLYRQHMNIYVFVNDGADISFFNSHNLTVFFYNPTDTFPRKVLSCLQHVPSEYVLYDQDIFLPMRYSHDTMSAVLDYMKANDIHKVEAHLHGYFPTLNVNPMNNPNPSMQITQKFSISRVANFFPYNVGPTIWNKEVLTDILDKFQHKSYREIESAYPGNAWQYVNEKYNVFTPTPYKHALVQVAQTTWMNLEFAFVHIIGGGRFLKSNIDDFYFADELSDLFTKHNIDMEWSNHGNRT